MSLHKMLLSPSSCRRPTPRSSRAAPTPGQYAPRVGLEPLEIRRLLSADLQTDLIAGGPGFGGPDEFEVTASARSNTISDPRGDFLPTYTGPHDPGLDVVAHQVTLVGDRVIFFGRMAGPIAPTQDIGGLYVIGIDRGRGTPRFLGGTPRIGPNVLWDLIVRINPNGTGLVNNQIAGVVTQLDPAGIRISGTQFVASVPLSLLTPAPAALLPLLPPEQWTYNLWPRNGLVPGRNENVSDLAPDDGNSPVQVLSRNGGIGYGQFGPAAVAAPEDVGRSGGAVAASEIFAHAGQIADDVLGAGGGSVLA